MKLFSFKRKKQPNYRDEFIIKRDSLKYWTPELIEWIGKTDDPVILAVASSLVNTGNWPKWLPGKPENYNREDSTLLHFVVRVHEMLTNKSEKISPGLHYYIWMTQYYDNEKFK